jgi:hypothetical protein
MLTDRAEQLRDLARRVDRLVPDRREPDRFHEDKSEIAGDLRRLARGDAPATTRRPPRDQR